MMKLRGVLCGAVAAGLLGLAAPASAALITGEFGIGGSFTYDALNAIGGAGLDFNLVLPPPTGPAGSFFQITAATGYFAGLGMTPGGTGSILNIDGGPGVTAVSNPPYTYAPAGTTGAPYPIANFLSAFSQAAGLSFTLTSIALQGGPGCPTTPSCAEGPFLLTDTVNGMRVDFDVFGTFIRGGDSGNYVGAFAVTMAGMTIATAGARILAGQDIACGAGNVTQPCAFAATFNPSTVPEPATLLTFGAGSLVLARLRRRKTA